MQRSPRRREVAAKRRERVPWEERRGLCKVPDEAKSHGIRRDENARMARCRSGAADRARARRVQPRGRPAAARANGDSSAYARPYRNRNAPARRDIYSRADARPRRNAPANRDSRAPANGAPDSAVRVPPKRPNAPERPGAACANAYSSPNAPAPNRDRDARPNRDPYPRADDDDAYRRPYADADARAVRRMARRPPRRLSLRRPRARRGAHARRRLDLDDRGSRRRQVRAPLLLRHVVTELRRRVSDAQRPLRRLQGRR